MQIVKLRKKEEGKKFTNNLYQKRFFLSLNERKTQSESVLCFSDDINVCVCMGEKVSVL